jgi:hypothetical protein
MPMSPIVVIQLDPKCQLDHIGFVPSFLDLDDSRPAREQFDGNYQHGGGWRPQAKFKRTGNEEFALMYPGDPPLTPLAAIPFRDELVVIYRYGYVAIFQKDGSFEACRMD